MCGSWTLPLCAAAPSAVGSELQELYKSVLSHQKGLIIFSVYRPHYRMAHGAVYGQLQWSQTAVAQNLQRKPNQGLTRGREVPIIFLCPSKGGGSAPFFNGRQPLFCSGDLPEEKERGTVKLDLNRVLELPGEADVVTAHSRPPERSHRPRRSRSAPRCGSRYAPPAAPMGPGSGRTVPSA